MTRAVILRALGAGLCIASLAACGGSNGGGTPSPTGSASTAAVTIHVVADATTIGAFNPKNATAKVGDTVAWSFDDAANSHTVTSDSGAPADFDSGTQAQGQTFTFTFAKAGTYAYHCNLHADMKGTITVSA